MTTKKHVTTATKAAHPKPTAREVADKIIRAAKSAAFTDDSPERCFAHFKDDAAQVPVAGLAVFTGQPLLMRANVLRALDALEPHLPAAVERLAAPELVPLFELPALTFALDFAVTRVPAAKLSGGDIDRMLAAGAPWRELMLSFLEVASHPLLGLLPRERVAAVRAGSGKLDKARDFVAIPGLFAEFAGALEGKHPFAAQKIAELGALGSALVAQLRPGRAPVEATKRSPESILRDQFASLVVGAYDHLQVMAALALGKRKADELLPALQSSMATVEASPAPSPEPAPAPPPAPPPAAATPTIAPSTGAS